MKILTKLKATKTSMLPEDVIKEMKEDIKIKNLISSEDPIELTEEDFLEDKTFYTKALIDLDEGRIIFESVENPGHLIIDDRKLGLTSIKCTMRKFLKRYKGDYLNLI